MLRSLPALPPLLLLLLLLCSCGPAQEDTGPTGVDEIKTALREKRDQIRELSREIEALEDTLATLDPTFAPKVALVEYQTVEPTDFRDFARVQATVRAAETAVATAEIPGRILRMNFAEGDAIRRGQLVAVLDVEGTETQRAELETAAELARTVYERQERLWEQNIGSEIQYLQAKNNYERLQQQLKSIDVQANKRNVYAPLSGTVERVTLRTGENAVPGAPILSIISTGDLKVVADAPEDLLTKVERRQEVGVAVPALGLEFRAPVSRIGRTVDPANRTFEVEIDVPRAHVGRLKANLLAEVEILDFAGEDLLVVSQDIIQQEVGGQRYVFVARPAEGGGSGDHLVARKTYVTTGKSYDNRAIVESGLQAGDRLITTGARGLTDGQAIALTQNPIESK